MSYYIAVFLMSIFLSLHFLKKSEDTTRIGYFNYNDFKYRHYTIKNYIGIFFVALPAIIVSGIRYDVGTDYIGTYTVDYNLIKMGYGTRNEPFSTLLYKLSIFLSEAPQVFFFLSSIICVGLAFVGIYKYSVRPLYAIILYFLTYQYFLSMNIIRQMIAMVIVFVGLKYLFEKRYVEFILVVGMATLFHYSALLYLLLIPFAMLKIDFKNSIVFFALSIVFVQFLKAPIVSLIERTPYALYLYIDNEFQVSVLFILINIFAYLVMGLYYNKKNARYQLFMNIQMAILLLSVVQSIFPLMGRVIQFFSFFRFIIIPEISVNIRNKKIRLLFDLVMITFYFVHCLYSLIVKNGDNVLPYKTFFEC